MAVACAAPVAGTVVRYTVDGSDPAAAAALTYAGPFPLTQPGTYVVRALGTGDHMFPSAATASAPIEVEPVPTCVANYYATSTVSAGCSPPPPSPPPRLPPPHPSPLPAQRPGSAGPTRR